MYGLSIGDNCDLGCTLAYFFRGHNFWQRIYLAHYLSERVKIWQRWRSGQSKHNIPRISWTLIWGSHDTMRRHASVFHRYTCKVVFFSTTFLCLPIVLVFFLFAALPEDYVHASFLYKCPALRGGSLRLHGLLVFIKHVQLLVLLCRIAGTTYVDAASCYRPSSVVCRSVGRLVCLSVGRSVCRSREPSKIGWTDRDAVWMWTRVGPRNHVLDRVQIPMRMGNFGERDGQL